MHYKCDVLDKKLEDNQANFIFGRVEGGVVDLTRKYGIVTYEINGESPDIEYVRVCVIYCN